MAQSLDIAIFSISIDIVGRGEIGYGLLAKACGFGFMHEALTAFLNCVLHGFSRGLRVTAQVCAGNRGRDQGEKRQHEADLLHTLLIGRNRSCLQPRMR